MAKAKQFTISAEDRPGMLARIANLLGNAHVNIVAMNCATFGVHGAIQIVVDHVDKARSSGSSAPSLYRAGRTLSRIAECAGLSGRVCRKIRRAENQCDLRVCHGRRWMREGQCRDAGFGLGRCHPDAMSG